MARLTEFHRQHSTSHRSVALALVVRPVTASRGTTTRCPDCTGSTAPMPCIRTRRLAARLLVGRSHWLPPCVRSLRLAAQLLVVRIASALLRLCRASGRVVSLLDFSSVGRTGSRCASGFYGTSRGLSRGSSSTTSPTPRVRVPRHVARLVVWLIVDYFASRSGASARRVARRRLLRLRHTSGCLGVVWTSMGPLPRWVPGPTTRWAPGTIRLALHGT
jgi:hypothetical protein